MRRRSALRGPDRGRKQMPWLRRSVFFERAFPPGLFVAPRRRGRMEGGMRAGLHSPLKRRGGSDCKTKRNFSRPCFSPVNSDGNMERKNAGPAFFKKQDRRSQDSIGSRFRKKGRHRPVFSPRVPPRWRSFFDRAQCGASSGQDDGSGERRIRRRCWRIWRFSR